MRHTNRFSTMRIICSSIMALVFIIANTVMCFLASVLVDKYICIIAIDIVFFLIFLLLIIKKRLEGALPEFNYISYGKMIMVVLLDWVITIVCAAFAPTFFAPFMVIPILSSAIFDDSLSNVLSLYLVIITALCWDYDSYLILCYVTLVSFGTIIARLIKSDEQIEKFYGMLIIFASTTLISIIFYYFNYLELTISILFIAMADGAITAFGAMAATTLIKKTVEKAQIQCYDEFLNPDYSLCQDIRKFSYIEYQHANRVSRLSRLCAEAIYANGDLAACGGLYYRLGKIEGEPVIDNAIKIANNHCFPNDVIQILAEYGAIIYLPSTKESAIVQMVDAVVTKVELFDSDSMTSSWNQNMVIYQTINELSQKGYYDNSGLSMNQFLTIREILANEDILA